MIVGRGSSEGNEWRTPVYDDVRSTRYTDDDKGVNKRVTATAETKTINRRKERTKGARTTVEKRQRVQRERETKNVQVERR